MSNQTKEPDWKSTGPKIPKQLYTGGIIADGLIRAAQESFVASLCHCANAIIITRDHPEKANLLKSCIVDYVAELLRLTLDIPAEEKEEEDEL
jgi:hypothetical protein